MSDITKYLYHALEADVYVFPKGRFLQIDAFDLYF